MEEIDIPKIKDDYEWCWWWNFIYLLINSENNIWQYKWDIIMAYKIVTQNWVITNDAYNECGILGKNIQISNLKTSKVQCS